jgi:hypothetical protein
VRATLTEAQMRDDLVLTLRLCEVDGFRTGVSHVPGLDASPVMTALSGWSRRHIRSRTSLARLPQPAGPAFRAAKLSINAEIRGFGTTTR